VSPRSILVLITSGLIAVAVGGAIIVGATASRAQSVAVQQPPAALAAPPNTTLHLPKTINMISQIDGQAKLDSIHQLVNDALSRPGNGRLLGTAAFSCAGVRGSSPQEICNGALAFRSGAMLVQEDLDVKTATISGTVIGGSGSYAGARGYLTGQEKGGGKSALTVSYNLH
jgi:hypothetical protein